MEVIPIRRVPTDVEALLQSAMDGLKAQAKGLEIAIDVGSSGTLPQVAIDPEKIAWAVTTLVGNALRHVRRGSRHLPGGTIHVRVAMDAETLVVTVMDDGPGIPAEKVPYLFKREEGKLHASGLSLMMVHDVICAHGGTVEVKSTTKGSDHGSEITMRIPGKS